MIEVNLLPGATRRAPRRAGRAAGPSIASRLDRWKVAGAAAWVLGGGLALWLYLDANERRQDLEIAIEEAVQDSVRLNGLLERQDLLRARRDTIANKLVLIQEIDADRYVWPHLLDEVSKALPDYTWITRLATESGGHDDLVFQIVGRTGNTFALTRFLKDLEASPFIKGVQLTRTEVVRDSNERALHQFSLTARYEEPPIELLSTVPIQLGSD